MLLQPPLPGVLGPVCFFLVQVSFVLFLPPPHTPPYTHRACMGERVGGDGGASQSNLKTAPYPKPVLRVAFLKFLLHSADFSPPTRSVWGGRREKWAECRVKF